MKKQNTKIILIRRQSFSGYITQFNLWEFALEDYAIENIAQCRSDNWGSVWSSKLENFELGSDGITVRISKYYPS